MGGGEREEGCEERLEEIDVAWMVGKMMEGEVSDGDKAGTRRADMEDGTDQVPSQTKRRRVRGCVPCRIGRRR